MVTKNFTLTQRPGLFCSGKLLARIAPARAVSSYMAAGRFRVPTGDTTPARWTAGRAIKTRGNESLLSYGRDRKPVAAAGHPQTDLERMAGEWQ